MTPKRLKKSWSPLTNAEEKALEVVKVLRAHNHQAYFVGGAVRDRLLGILPHEVDIATNARPEVIQGLFPKTYAVGAAFGVIIVLMDERKIEVATFRSDGSYIDGRHPSMVEFSDPEHDACRRDFTINALFFDPIAEEIIDFVGGLEDLRQGVVRAIGDPTTRFSEDFLRMIRAVRFTARFQFLLAPATFAAIPLLARNIGLVSPERLFDELTKILTGPHSYQAFPLLSASNLIHYILPEIEAMKSVNQPIEHHPEGDVWNHTMLLLENMGQADALLAWCCLLHDVGKPPTFAIGKNGTETFPAHAKVGAHMTEEILKRFHCSRHFITSVSEIVYNHMAFADVQRMKRSTLRRLLARPTFNTELELHRIDCLSCHRKLDNYYFLCEKMREFAAEPPVPKSLLTGHDVMNRGIRPGPEIGTVLKDALDQQLNHDINTREEMLIWLDRYLGRHDHQSTSTGDAP